MTFQKGVKFRIYPNREQRNLIDRTLGCSRLIYNKGLAMREDAFKSGEKCGYKQTSAMLTALKQDVNYAFLKEVDSIALQQALRNLDTGYTNFFEHRAAHPKFKNKKSSKMWLLRISASENGNARLVTRFMTETRTLPLTFCVKGLKSPLKLIHTVPWDTREVTPV